ncbi:MAG: hypothetical protein QME78_00060 [Thermodesulfobacteriota bacterium]|nr:hypothetical protein [Thermodesulfobacteriota bacterium]
MADLRICPNPRCRLVYRPDPQIYKDPHNYCPKCGTDLNQRPAWKGRDDG